MPYGKGGTLRGIDLRAQRIEPIAEFVRRLGTVVIVFAGSLWLVRSQATVGDVAYMKAMIPHHSIAIMTRRRAHIRDPRLREFADGIIAAQEREIAEMDRLIADMETNPTPPDAPDLQPAS